MTDRCINCGAPICTQPRTNGDYYHSESRSKWCYGGRMAHGNLVAAPATYVIEEEPV